MTEVFPFECPVCGHKTNMSKTNSDRIRNMNDEELAMFLCNFRSCDADEYICEGCKAEKYCRAGHAGTIDWLQQPAEEADNAIVEEQKDGDWNG